MRKPWEITAAQAIVELDAEKAVDALMFHPLMSSYSLAKSMVKDYFKAYQEYTGGII